MVWILGHARRQSVLAKMIQLGALLLGFWPVLSLALPLSAAEVEAALPFHIPMIVFVLFLVAVVLVLVWQVRRLRMLQREYEALLEHTPNPIFIKSPDGHYARVSRSFYRMIGYDKGSLIGKSTSACVPNSLGYQNLLALDQQVIASRQPCQTDTVLSTVSGDRYIFATKFPLFDEHGDLSAIGCIMLDRTEQKQAEARRFELEEQYRALVNQSLVGIYILQDDKLVYVNERTANLMGYGVDELTEMPLSVCMPPEEYTRIREQIAHRYAEKIEALSYTTQVLHKQGNVLDIEVHSRLFEYRGRQAILGVVLDISERRHAENRLRLASTVFDNSSEGILLTDANARIIALNAAFTRITGFSEAQAIGRFSRMFRVDHMGRSVNEQMMRALAEKGQWQGEFLDRRKGGDLYPVWLSISSVHDEFNVLTNYVCVFSDITQRKLSEDRLQFLASHDPLTRLPNRSSFIERLDTALLRAQEQGTQVAVMFIDLDRFKLINDSFGHPAGDDLLRVIAARLIYAVGEEGFLARLGGDEFTVLLERSCDRQTIVSVAERLLAELSQPLKLEEHELFVTGSIGISMYPNDGADSMLLLKNADVAMYRAKEAGKNTYEFFASSMNEQAFERLLMENGLRQAIERGELMLHYQPQINAFSEQIEAVEALLRWNHPELGMVSPAKFIPVAEESGLIRPIGEWVIQEACRQVRAWDDAGVPIRQVAVNLSARQFLDHRLSDKVMAALEDAGIDSSRLELEVTESMLMQDPAEAIKILMELKSLGLKLAIDDFGTGYSSLSNLKRFPLDCLKVDRSFVEGVPDDNDNAAITEAIIAMAKKLRLTVVAEGVENAEQRLFLRRCGCELIQGFYYSRPLPPEALAQFVMARTAQAALLEASAITETTEAKSLCASAK